VGLLALEIVHVAAVQPFCFVAVEIIMRGVWYGLLVVFFFFASCGFDVGEIRGCLCWRCQFFWISVRF